MAKQPKLQDDEKGGTPGVSASVVDMSSAESTSRVLAETMVRALVDKMKAVAESKGGYLSVSDLEAM